MANVAIGAHLGRDKTWQKVSEHFYWKVLWTDVQEYNYTSRDVRIARTCVAAPSCVCMKNKKKKKQ